MLFIFQLNEWFMVKLANDKSFGCLHVVTNSETIEN